ncbi:MAG: signal peptidase II [Gammaproteobacteria bacterium]
MTLKHWLLIALAVVIFDQITKQLAEHLLTYGQPLAVLPNFNLTLLYNKGAAFSFLNSAGGWQRWLFTAIALIVSGVIIIWLKEAGEEQRWTPAALVLILGGAVGNVIDRILFGHVIDFIQVYYKTFYWPAFNVADSAICVGAAILLLSGWFLKPQNTAQ